MGLLRDRGEVTQPGEELRLLSLAVNGTDQAVLVLDQNKCIAYVNHAFTDMFGFRPPEVIGKKLTDFLAGGNANSSESQRAKQPAGETYGLHQEALFQSKEGREVWVSSSVNPVRDDQGRIRNFIAVLSDVTDTKHIQALQRIVLEAVVSGLPLRDVADLLCRRVEAIAPEVIASMVLLDSDQRLVPLAAPSLPNFYSGP